MYVFSRASLAHGLCCCRPALPQHAAHISPTYCSISDISDPTAVQLRSHLICVLVRGATVMVCEQLGGRRCCCCVTGSLRTHAHGAAGMSSTSSNLSSPLVEQRSLATAFAAATFARACSSAAFSAAAQAASAHTSSDALPPRTVVVQPLRFLQRHVVRLQSVAELQHALSPHVALSQRIVLQHPVLLYGRPPPPPLALQHVAHECFAVVAERPGAPR